jgi:FtsP/CotA-like multicopper oxidase with cupredoxin domain
MERAYALSMPFSTMTDLRRAICTQLLLVAIAVIQIPATAAGTPYDPHSSPEAPCGRGLPPPGHDSPDIAANGVEIDLIVRQDGSRLCYVNHDDADAPVIHARLGGELVINLRNEITDPQAIDSVSGPGKLTSANEAVPSSPEYYAVVPGMHHAASGATNLHVHGFAVPPTQPQDEVLITCTDPATGAAGTRPARCGQRSFTYRYHVPADMPEGLYWYHPHVHGEVQAQMLMGLTGALIVEGPLADARHRDGIVERLLIVRQMQDQDGVRAQPAAMTAASADPIAAAKTDGKLATQIDTAHELLCTRNAGIDAISLNGTPVPVSLADDAAYAHYSIAAGSKQYWRVLNAATDAFLSLSVVDEKGSALPMQVIAVDGAPLSDDSGALSATTDSSEPQLVPPAGRLEVMVTGPAEGKKAYLVTHAVDTGCAGDRLPERRLAVIEGTAAQASSLRPSTAPVRPANLFSGLLAQRTVQRRVIAMAEYPRPGADDQIDFYIAESKPGAVLKPYHMGDQPGITVRAGTTEEWTIENWTNELHAFHIHQVHFRVLEVDGVPVAHPPLLDVVNVPYATATGYHSKEGPIRPGRVRIKLSFPARLQGDIPFHCHLVDHEDNGMMGVVRVLPATGAMSLEPSASMQ